MRPNGLSPGAPTVFADRRPVATLFFHQRAGVRLSDVESTGMLEMIVVVFQPFAAKAFLHMPVSEFRGMNVNTEETGKRRERKKETKENRVTENGCQKEDGCTYELYPDI